MKLNLLSLTLLCILIENVSNEAEVGLKVKNDKTESRVNATSFLDNPHLLGIIPGNRGIRGITVMDRQLFVVRGGSKQVFVYNTDNLTLTRKIRITGSSSLRAIASSQRYNSLFVSDSKLRIVYRYKLSDNVISNWPVGGRCFGLSFSSTQNILVTLYDTKQIKEYTPDGSLVREIHLASGIAEPRHCIQLSSGQFVVSQGEGRAPHRACLVDTIGDIIHCHGGSGGSGARKLNVPSDLAVDEYGNVLVADYGNNRAVLLSPSLAYLGDITIPGYTLSFTCALYLDLLTRRLYIGEATTTGRLFVLTV